MLKFPSFLTWRGAGTGCLPARKPERNLSGRSAAWLARLVRDQEVGGSNPLAPTIERKRRLGAHSPGLLSQGRHYPDTW